MKESSQKEKDQLVSEQGIDPITEEQIAKVRTRNEKYKNYHINVDAP